MLMAGMDRNDCNISVKVSLINDNNEEETLEKLAALLGASVIRNGRAVESRS